MKLHIGDEIIVTAGKDKGRRGKIDRIIPAKDRVLIQGVNVYKKAKKGFAGNPGGMIEFSRPLPTASVSLICPKCGKQTRIGWEIDKRGEKARICKKCKSSVEIKVGKKNAK